MSSSPIPPPVQSLTVSLLSLLSSLLHVPSYSILCTLLCALPYSEVSLLHNPSTIRTSTKLHPLRSLFVLSYSFASPASTTNEPRAPAKSNPTYLSWDLISARVSLLSVLPALLPLASLRRSIYIVTVDFFRRTTAVNAGASVPLMHPSPRVTTPSCDRRYSFAERRISHAVIVRAINRKEYECTWKNAS